MVLTDEEKKKERNEYMCLYNLKNKDRLNAKKFDNIQVVPAKWNQSKSNLHNDLYFTKHEVAING